LTKGPYIKLIFFAVANLRKILLAQKNLGEP